MNQKKHDFYPVKVTDVHINGKPSTYPMVTVGSGISRIGLEPSEKNVTFCFPTFPILLLLLCPMNTSWRVGMTVG